jgi:hypothetical protein
VNVNFSVDAEPGFAMSWPSTSPQLAGIETGADINSLLMKIKHHAGYYWISDMKSARVTRGHPERFNEIIS